MVWRKYDCCAPSEKPNQTCCLSLNLRALLPTGKNRTRIDFLPKHDKNMFLFIVSMTSEIGAEPFPARPYVLSQTRGWLWAKMDVLIADTSQLGHLQEGLGLSASLTHGPGRFWPKQCDVWSAEFIINIYGEKKSSTARAHVTQSI